MSILLLESFNIWEFFLLPLFVNITLLCQIFKNQYFLSQNSAFVFIFIFWWN